MNIPRGPCLGCGKREVQNITATELLENRDWRSARNDRDGVVDVCAQCESSGRVERYGENNLRVRVVRPVPE